MATRAVLFDIGGVLTPDPWETLLLHPELGVLRERNIGLAAASARIAPVWDVFSVLPDAKESHFWRAAAHALDADIDEAALETCWPQLIAPNVETTAVFEQLTAADIRIGLISNNTAFFYPRQAKLLSIDSYIDESLSYLSHRAGITKANGLFESAAHQLGTTADVLVIDDRLSNIERARACGFATLHYELGQRGSLLRMIDGWLHETADIMDRGAPMGSPTPHRRGGMHTALW